MIDLRNALLIAGAAASIGVGARAANVNDLAEIYSGRLHHSANAAGENEGFGFAVTSISPNGKFVGDLGDGIVMNGKVTSTGKMTFAVNGSNSKGSLKMTKGKGQLSATGRFIVGSFQLKANPPIPNVPDGAYTFEVEAGNLDPLRTRTLR